MEACKTVGMMQNAMPANKAATHVDNLMSALREVEAVRYRAERLLAAITHGPCSDSKGDTETPMPSLVGCLESTPAAIHDVCGTIHGLLNEIQDRLRV